MKAELIYWNPYIVVQEGNTYYGKRSAGVRYRFSLELSDEEQKKFHDNNDQELKNQIIDVMRQALKDCQLPATKDEDPDV